MEISERGLLGHFRKWVLVVSPQTVPILMADGPEAPLLTHWCTGAAWAGPPIAWGSNHGWLLEGKPSEDVCHVIHFIERVS